MLINTNIDNNIIDEVKSADFTINKNEAERYTEDFYDLMSLRVFIYIYILYFFNLKTIYIFNFLICREVTVL